MIIISRKSETAFTQICNFLEANPSNRVTLRSLTKPFGYRSIDSLKRMFSRNQCLVYKKEKIPGKNKFRYIAKHEKSKHLATLVKKEREKILRLDNRDLDTRIVGVHDFSAFLSGSETFKDYLEFEVHGMRYISSSEHLACDPTIFVNKEIEWIYCDYVVNINAGQLLVFTRPNKKFKKYGLNKDRYREFIKHRDITIKKILKDILGFDYDAAYFLELVQFDLHQDDYLYEFKGKWNGKHLIMGMVEEYKITVQRYPVIRRDHPIAPSSRKIKRFETRFHGKKTIRDLSRIIPDILSLEVDHIQAIANIESWGNFMKSNAATLNHTVLNIIPSVMKLMLKIQEINPSSDGVYNFDNYSEELSNMLDEIVRVRNADQSSDMKEWHKKEYLQLSERLETVETFALERLESYSNEKELLEQIYIAYNAHNQSLREIGNQLGRSHTWVKTQLIKLNQKQDTEITVQAEWRNSLAKSIENQSEVLKKSDSDIQTIKSGINANYDLIETSRSEMVVGMNNLVLVQKTVPVKNTKFIELNYKFQESIIAAIKSNPGINSTKLRFILGVNNQKLIDNLHLLKVNGDIYLQKNGRGNSWHINRRKNK